jgi:dTDP-glucose 4,6-dehydratase
MGTVSSIIDARPLEKSILVTGAAGFIGANFVLNWIGLGVASIVSLDKLTYAGNLDNLASVANDPRHVFVHGDIGDIELVESLLKRYRPTAVVNFAAESHVDRSIHGPADFIATNVVGTFRLLETTRAFYDSLSLPEKAAFRFLHVSTDEDLAPSARMSRLLLRQIVISRTARTRRARRRPIILSALGATPMGFRC